MAHRDIMPYISPLGQTVDIQHFPMNAAETFVAGEPVRIDADGNLATCVDSATQAGFLGIALAPTPFSISGTLTNRNPRTGVPYAAGDPIPVAVARTGVRFITQNFAIDGAGTLTTPTLQLVMAAALGLIFTGGFWVLDDGVLGATLATFKGVDVLDANKNSLNDPRYVNNTGVWVVAESIGNQLTVVTAPEA